MAQNHLQGVLSELEDFSVRKQMKIKEKKTNLMKFNFSLNYDFPPELTLKGFKNHVDIVKETRLLGVILTDDLKWSANTNFICSKAYKKMWILRRLKVLNVGPILLLDVYCKEVRSVLEMGVPAWNSGLTVHQSEKIERVQKVAVSIILGKTHLKYHEALKLLSLEELRVRREKLCLNFARKTLKSRHSSMFIRNTSHYNTRHFNLYREEKANTKRFYMSPLNYITRLLNEN